MVREGCGVTSDVRGNWLSESGYIPPFSLYCNPLLWFYFPTVFENDKELFINERESEPLPSKLSELLGLYLSSCLLEKG